MLINFLQNEGHTLIFMEFYISQMEKFMKQYFWISTNFIASGQVFENHASTVSKVTYYLPGVVWKFVYLGKLLEGKSDHCL